MEGRPHLEQIAALAAAALAATVIAGCTRPMATRRPTAAPVIRGGWTSLSAEHRVRIDARTAGGREQRSLRGVIAIERPDRFRLRALGPGGLTIFDVLYVRGDVRVVESIQQAIPSGTFGRIVRSLGGDLVAAYDLEPRPSNRTARVEGSAVVVNERDRSVRLDEFRLFASQSVARVSAPTRITIDNHALDYRVVIDVIHLVLDEPLDPALFSTEQP